MALQPKSKYTYEDLAGFPDDNLRREIIDGELVVTAAPVIRHQRVVTKLIGALLEYARRHGGEVFPAPTDVYFSAHNVVEPDVLYVTAEHGDRIEEAFVRSAPDLVVEVSSPSTRRIDLVRKRALYERFAVPEYWYVDLDADRVEIYQRAGESFGPPAILERDATLGSSHLPGLSIRVDELLGEPGKD